jgi:hypothetical protein
VACGWRRGGFTTFPALMQEVQTLIRRGLPPTSARTRWMFGFHRRLVRRCEWDTLMPKPGLLPQSSHTAAIRTRHLDRKGLPGTGIEVTILGHGRDPAAL